jgi:hypothetical protein
VSTASETATRVMGAEKGLKEVLDRLCNLSVERAYDPFRDFEWPASVPEQGMWMSEDLLSVHGTPYMAELTEEQRWSLSRWELVNFFSYNVHGIKELMQTVLFCIHKSGHETTSEYFHHFLDEENKHMWFFAEFCKRYGGKIYVSQNLPIQTFAEDDIQSFIAFAKILIAEQIGDFYNARMMGDESLHPIVRKLNRVHHEDESRHIAMGLNVVRLMYQTIADKYPEETRRKIEAYLLGYMQFYLESFYNPSAYRDAGLQEPYEWRRKLIGAPERQKFHEKVLRRTTTFFENNGIIGQKMMPRDGAARQRTAHNG